jgi:hypothetical protein
MTNMFTCFCIAVALPVPQAASDSITPPSVDASLVITSMMGPAPFG